MSQITGGWELIREATADRQVDAIIAAYVDDLDQQYPILHALYEMLHDYQHEDVALILRMIQGEWL